MTSIDASLESRCLSALREAWNLPKSQRSKKLNVLCGRIRKEILQKLPDYDVYATGDGSPSSKRKVDGKYHRKRVNIVVSRDGSELGTINVRLIQSSYKKNANNYLEQQLGETANLRGQRLIYGNVVFLPYPVPPPPTNQDSEWEYLTDALLDPYRKLVDDHDSIVVPDVQAIVIAKLDQCTGELSMATRQDLYRLPASLDFLFEKVHISKFVRDYAADIASAYQKLAG